MKITLVILNGPRLPWDRFAKQVVMLGSLSPRPTNSAYTGIESPCFVAFRGTRAWPPACRMPRFCSAPYASTTSAPARSRLATSATGAPPTGPPAPGRPNFLYPSKQPFRPMAGLPLHRRESPPTLAHRASPADAGPARRAAASCPAPQRRSGRRPVQTPESRSNRTAPATVGGPVVAPPNSRGYLRTLEHV